MIPKTIHYCWFSDDLRDEISEHCFQSWKKYLPKYSFKLWSLKNIPQNISFLDKMIAGKHWAYASDYIRLYALYNEGGIYMDLDFELFRSLDPLLENSIFIGLEEVHSKSLGSHVMGSVPDHPFIEQCLAYYHNSIRLKWSFPPTMPRIITRIAEKHFGYSTLVPDGQILDQNIQIFPAHYFSPISFTQRNLSRTERYDRVHEDSIGLHHWLHGWNWLEEPLYKCYKKIPWLYMNGKDWLFLFRRLIVDRFKK